MNNQYYFSHLVFTCPQYLNSLAQKRFKIGQNLLLSSYWSGGCQGLSLCLIPWGNTFCPYRFPKYIQLCAKGLGITGADSSAANCAHRRAAPVLFHRQRKSQGPLTAPKMAIFIHASLVSEGYWDMLRAMQLSNTLHILLPNNSNNADVCTNTSACFWDSPMSINHRLPAEKARQFAVA